jgi:hypothetical protein
MNRTLHLAPLACAALLLAGCENMPGLPGQGTDAAKPAVTTPAHPKPATTTPGATPTPAAVNVTPPPVPADLLALKEGTAFYNNGDYANAIKRLTAPEIATGSKATQLAALKYSAFSYCVTSRTTLCRQQFDKAFKLDPAFDLAPGEHGHPLWGPVFTKAKKAK